MYAAVEAEKHLARSVLRLPGPNLLIKCLSAILTPGTAAPLILGPEGSRHNGPHRHDNKCSVHAWHAAKFVQGSHNASKLNLQCMAPGTAANKRLTHDEIRTLSGD
jgi:hypothetical protein